MPPTSFSFAVHSPWTAKGPSVPHFKKVIGDSAIRNCPRCHMVNRIWARLVRVGVLLVRRGLEFRDDGNFASSFHGSLILVQPIEDFLHHLVVCKDGNFSSLQDHVTLVFLRCSQRTKHHILQFQRKVKVITTTNQ